MNSHEIDTPHCACAGADRALLQTIVAELLCKNELLRRELHEARSRVARAEAILAGLENCSPPSRAPYDTALALRFIFSTETYTGRD
jgi:hypothetical protein